MSGWKIRPKDADEYDLPSLYAGRPTMCTLNFHHGGTCKVVDGRSFYTGQGSDAGENRHGNNEGVDGSEATGAQLESQAGSQGGSQGRSQPGSQVRSEAGSQGRSQPGGSSQGRSQPGGSSQGSQESQPGGSRRMGKKVVSKVRGKSQRILRHRLAKVTSGPGLTPEDAMEVD